MLRFNAIVTTSGPMVEHINDRRYWNFMEFHGTLRLGEKFRNFMELYNGSDGTEQLWKKGYVGRVESWIS